MTYSLTLYFSTEQEKEDFKRNLNKPKELPKEEVIETKSKKTKKK